MCEIDPFSDYGTSILLKLAYVMIIHLFVTLDILDHFSELWINKSRIGPKVWVVVVK
jgi:hypothetical protein